MNPGLQSTGDAIFLIKCADYKCLAARDANGKWRNFCGDAELPEVTKIIASVPYELVLPFLPEAKRKQLCPIPLPVQR